MDPFWEQAEVVERFGEREPDHRLALLIGAYERPASTRILDLGCAGGRNTLFLAEHGFEVHALDGSVAMVERTRERLRPLLGEEAARARVRVGRMDDLSGFADAEFELVVALGIYHNAQSRAEWDRAIAETVRVLSPAGKLLVNHFTPETDLTGAGVRRCRRARSIRRPPERSRRAPRCERSRCSTRTIRTASPRPERDGAGGDRNWSSRECERALSEGMKGLHTRRADSGGDHRAVRRRAARPGMLAPRDRVRA